MLNNPLVSIVMPCKNSEATITEAINSVLSQSLRDFELIVVNDGSTDSSVNIICSLLENDQRIKLINNPKPGKGVFDARNIALSAARGRYIAFLDSDDYLLPESLSLRVLMAQTRGAKVVYGSFLRLLPDGNTTLVKVKSQISFKDMLCRNHIGNLTGLYDSSYFGVVTQDNIKHEDYLMWCKLLQKVDCAVAVESPPLGVYRVSSTSLSGNKIKAFYWHWQVLRKGLNIGFIQAVYSQFYYTIYSFYLRLFAPAS